MKCNDSEISIYLYPELTAVEQRQVDAHISECAACAALWQSVQQSRSLVAKTSLIKPEPVNHARLTGNIMQAIANKKPERAARISNWFFKYAMVAASLLLMVGFGIEQLSPVELTKRMPAASEVVLESKSVSKSFLHRKEKREYKTSLYAYAKSGDCNNPFIKSFTRKSL